mmetsp:Transcript_13804/g.21328  ORF Transcript_13804/g.21328 Transcript_13804/m.21328 type:complete len:465 (-) Transcript_13804:117-1511(-)
MDRSKRKTAPISNGNCVSVGTVTASKVNTKDEPLVDQIRKKLKRDPSTQGNDLFTKSNSSAKKTSSATPPKQEKVCSQCKNLLRRESFSNSQYKRTSKKIKCKTCVSAEQPISKKSNNQNLHKQAGGKERKKQIDGKKTSNGKTSCKKQKSNTEQRPEVVKAKLIERAKTMPSGQKQRTFHLSWNASPVSGLDEMYMAEKVVEKGYWGVLDEQRKANIASYIKSSSSSMTLLQAVSLRQILLQQKAMFRHQVMQRQSNRLYKEYKDGKSVIELSESVDCPPLNVFRMILAKMKVSKAKIKESFKDPKKLLKKREQNELKHAQNRDAISSFDQAQMIEYADAFEDTIATFLNKKGIAFVRQNQLQEEQTREFGKNILTPDFLLLDAVTINGKNVTWIDAKAFYGANIPFNVKRMKKQLSRYIDHWGDGAVVYLQGFSETLTLNRCLFLNAHGVLNTDTLDHTVWT